MVFRFLSIFDNAETHDLTIESSSDIFALTSFSLVLMFAIAVLAFLTLAYVCDFLPTLTFMVFSLMKKAGNRDAPGPVMIIAYFSLLRNSNLEVGVGKLTIGKLTIGYLLIVKLFVCNILIVKLTVAEDRNGFK